VEDDEGRDSFLSCGNSPPLADVLFNSKSTEVDSVGTVDAAVAGRARDEYVVCGLRTASRFLRGDCTAISSQSGVAAQASQLPQRSHLGVSPKWRQTWRWRHSLDLHETLDFVVALPSTFFFSGIFDFADKKACKPVSFFCQNKKQSAGSASASGAARLLVVLARRSLEARDEITARTAALLMPKPKAIVPTMTRTSSAIHFS